jgi:hypothetical protein
MTRSFRVRLTHLMSGSKPALSPHSQRNSVMDAIAYPPPSQNLILRNVSPASPLVLSCQLSRAQPEIVPKTNLKIQIGNPKYNG